MTGHLRRRYIQRAAMAAIIIAIFYLINYTIVGAFDTIGPGARSVARDR